MQLLNHAYPPFNRPAGPDVVRLRCRIAMRRMSSRLARSDSRLFMRARPQRASAPAGHRSQNRVEDQVEALPDVLGKEPQHEVAVLLEQQVLAAVTSVGVGISQMLGAVRAPRRRGHQRTAGRPPGAPAGRTESPGTRSARTAPWSRGASPIAGTGTPPSRCGRVPRLRHQAALRRAACTNRLASGTSTPSRTSRCTLPE